MSGFELIIILIIVANVVAAILKKRAQSKGGGAGSTQRGQGEFEEDEEVPAYPDFGGRTKRQTPDHAARLETTEEEMSSLEARGGTERVTMPAAHAPMVRKRSQALQVIEFSHRAPRILGLQSKSDLRRAFLLSEVLGPPRALSKD